MAPAGRPINATRALLRYALHDGGPDWSDALPLLAAVMKGIVERHGRDACTRQRRGISRCPRRRRGLDENTGRRRGVNCRKTEGTMRDERLARVEESFRRAWAVEAALGDLLQRNPEPRMPDKGLPPDWNEAKSYARCASLLHQPLAAALRSIDADGLFRHVAVLRASPDAIARTVECFREAHRLMADLKDLQKHLPDPGVSAEGKLPPEWSEFHDYAASVSAVKAAISFGLTQATMDATLRHEFDIVRALAA